MTESVESLASAFAEPQAQAGADGGTPEDLLPSLTTWQVLVRS